VASPSGTCAKLWAGDGDTGKTKDAAGRRAALQMSAGVVLGVNSNETMVNRLSRFSLLYGRR